ncbi:hypothetical protein ACJX0J_028232, partial [Zea mays]
SIAYYDKGLEILMATLGERDPPSQRPAATDAMRLPDVVLVLFVTWISGRPPVKHTECQDIALNNYLEGQLCPGFSLVFLRLSHKTKLSLALTFFQIS